MEYFRHCISLYDRDMKSIGEAYLSEERAANILTDKEKYICLIWQPNVLRLNPHNECCYVDAVNASKVLIGCWMEIVNPDRELVRMFEEKNLPPPPPRIVGIVARPEHVLRVKDLKNGKWTG